MNQAGLLATLIALAGAALPALATGPASGTYRGSGHWEGADGTKGTYTVETTVRDATITSRWNYQVDGKAQTQAMTVSLVPAADGSLQILDEKRGPLGSARCLDEECLLTYELGPIKLVETLRTRDGRLENFGAKSGPGFSIVYSSTAAAR